MELRQRHYHFYGFTIVELLVTLAIIGMLLAVVLASFSAARAKGRDVERETEIQRLAVELRIFAEKHGRYPSALDGNCDAETSFGVGGCLTILVDEGFLPSLPDDPLGESYTGNPQSHHMYFYDNECGSGGTSGTQYRLWANGERNHNATTAGWWNDQTIGATVCDDPV